MRYGLDLGLRIFVNKVIDAVLFMQTGINGFYIPYTRAINGTAFDFTVDYRYTSAPLVEGSYMDLNFVGEVTPVGQFVSATPPAAYEFSSKLSLFD